MNITKQGESVEKQKKSVMEVDTPYCNVKDRVTSVDPQSSKEQEEVSDSFCRVNQVEIELDSDVTVPSEECYTSAGVVIVSFNDNSDAGNDNLSGFLISRKNEKGRAPLWEVPNGRLKKGENLASVSYRELKEEAGVMNLSATHGERHIARSV